MNSNDLKIKFYTIDGKEIDISEVEQLDSIELEDDVKNSKEYNVALMRVIKKDINVINNKLNSISLDIKKELAKSGAIVNMEEEYSVMNIDSFISKIEMLISELIVEKNSIKIRIFTSDKKGKKDRILKLDSCIEFLSKRQNEVISIKNEYTKLEERKSKIKNIDDYFELEDEDPLGRTINFYMKKDNE